MSRGVGGVGDAEAGRLAGAEVMEVGLPAGAGDPYSGGFGFGAAASAVDVHQHLWPAGLIEALRARRRAPRMHGWTLELAGEPDYEIDPADHDVDLRTAQATEDGLDAALVSLSSPLGIESLPPDEAGELLAAYHEGVLGLPAPFGGWAAACVSEIDPGALARELDRGFVGLQLPATALLDARGYAHVRPLLDVLQATGRPLLIHPGPAAAGGDPAALGGGAAAPGGGAAAPGEGLAMSAAEAASPTAPGTPAWWPAVVSYVQQMHAAWFAFRAHGRPSHPDLKVCFALLAGLAPLHGERVAARTGDRNVIDHDVFLEISSYGTRAVDATIRVLGVDGLVHGSDRPYADPATLDLGAAAMHALRSANPMRLLYPKEVVHDMAVAASA
jgi:6-methylsalicylate decarboxylase